MKYVYLAKAGDDYKVGIAINVTERIKTLQTSNPNKIEVVMTRLVDDAYRIEQATHLYVQHMKSGGGTEWFTLTHEQAIELAIHICKNPEIDMAQEISVAEMINRQSKIQQELNDKVNIALRLLKANNKNITAIPRLADLPTPPRRKLSTVTATAFDDQKLADQAYKIFIEAGKASTSLMQRKMNLGYGRAARIMDILEQAGKISAWDGQAARSVYASSDSVSD